MRHMLDALAREVNNFRTENKRLKAELSALKKRLEESPECEIHLPPEKHFVVRIVLDTATWIRLGDPGEFCKVRIVNLPLAGDSSE